MGPVAAAVAARARLAILDLLRAARGRPADPDGALGAALRLVGLGPGGTPSGDDFLVGFVGAWRRLGGDDAAERIAAALAAQAPARTSRLAAEFYYHLARGRLSAPLAALLAAAAGGDATRVAAHADLLARYGATSGCDTIAGVHAYLAATPRA